MEGNAYVHLPSYQCSSLFELPLISIVSSLRDALPLITIYSYLFIYLEPSHFLLLSTSNSYHLFFSFSSLVLFFCNRERTSNSCWCSNEVEERNECRWRRRKRLSSLWAKMRKYAKLWKDNPHFVFMTHWNLSPSPSLILVFIPKKEVERGDICDIPFSLPYLHGVSIGDGTRLVLSLYSICTISLISIPLSTSQLVLIPLSQWIWIDE